jgi:hypothetical protein
MIQVWISKDDAANVAALAAKLDKLLTEKADGDKLTLRAFLMFIDPARKADAEKIVADQKLEKVSVGILPEKQKGTVEKYKISEEVKNTVLVARAKKVTANFVDVTDKDFDKLLEAVK